MLRPMGDLGECSSRNRIVDGMGWCSWTCSRVLLAHTDAFYSTNTTAICQRFSFLFKLEIVLMSTEQMSSLIYSRTSEQFENSTVLEINMIHNPQTTYLGTKVNIHQFGRWTRNSARFLMYSLFPAVERISQLCFVFSNRNNIQDDEMLGGSGASVFKSEPRLNSQRRWC